MPLGAPAYGAAFVASLALTFVLTPLVLRFADRRRFLDHPGGHKGHEAPVPYLGGLAIAVAFTLAVLAAAIVLRPPGGLPELFVILTLAVVLSAMGLLDDLRGLSPWLRLGIEITAAVVLYALGSGVALFAVPVLDLGFTVLWIVGVTNAFNLLDNMDGLSAGVAAIAAAFFFLLAAVNGQYLVAALAVAVAGCALGFLRHNFHPARIYMGDAGSLFLGFLLAVIGIKLRFDGPTYVTFFVPILVLGVAIFDTVLVTTTRLLHGRSPLSGGRDHTSHRLVFVGIPVPVSVSLIYAGAISLGWLAVVMARVDAFTGFILMGFVLAVAAFLGLLLGAVPVYETSKRRRMMIQEVAPHEEKQPA